MDIQQIKLECLKLAQLMACDHSPEEVLKLARQILEWVTSV
jgi:hypothetical protein